MEDMEDFYLWEEAEMVPVLERSRRDRRDFFEELSNEEFFSTTRFTKEGAVILSERLQGRLQGESQRGHPLTPLAQVIFFHIILTETMMINHRCVLHLPYWQGTTTKGLVEYLVAFLLPP